jgi:hypothetical protein
MPFQSTGPLEQHEPATKEPIFAPLAHNSHIANGSKHRYESNTREASQRKDSTSFSARSVRQRV